MMLAIPNGLRRLEPPAVAIQPAGPVSAVLVSIDNAIAISPKQAYAPLIAEAAALYRIDAALIASVMEAESAFNPFAVSRTGAMGLMQLMPDVAAEHGANEPFDPRENIMAGARYLSQLLDRFNGNVELTLAGYNAGPTAVARYGAVPPFRETRRYVKTVKGLLAAAHRSNPRPAGND